ncbi:MAG TPA: mevalonate kinase [Nitrososphaerales archaeon]|nr:mevalonate kinase [Nitrososphaerales archaeon]
MPLKAVCEAPGKVIISGEHFVVHGATALAAAIERKVRVEASWSDTLEIRSSATGGKEALAPAKKLVEYLYAARGTKPRLSMRITSTIAEGAGLGSSAATMVALAGAASALEGWGMDQAALAEAAATGEKVIHGNPSGIDTTTSATGGVILFRRGEEPRRIDLTSPLTLLVAFSGKKRSTGRLIAKVSEMKMTYPSLFESLCESATLVSELCARALKDGETATLGSLMTYNHAVLTRAGASTRGLDELVELCLASGCLGAKLTGAGGGGSVLAVPPKDPLEAQAVANKLGSAGYDAFFTTIPTSGARSWTE